MKKCIITVTDEVNCTIGGLLAEHQEVLWEKFGLFVEGYFFMPKFQLKRWDGKIHFFDKRNNTYVKLLIEIIPYLLSWDYDIEFNDKRDIVPNIDTRVHEDFFGTAFKFRPYQVKVINELLEEGSGIAVCATGSGKTAMVAAIAAILAKHQLQTLVIVPATDLVIQTVNEFRDKLQNFPVTIGEYSGSEKNIDHPIVVATWQALQNVPETMRYFQAVVVDECHGVKATVIKDLVNVHGKHISFRYGCTGTLPKNITDQYNLKISLGRVVSEVTASWLIEREYLSEIQIQPLVTIDHDPEVPEYSQERAYLTGCTDRNTAIAQMIIKLHKDYGNTLVLCNTQALPQGREIAGMIDNAVYLDGTSATSLRQENYQQYAERDDIIIIASAGIASTGISIDRIFLLVLLDTGKSFIKCIQSVGRGLRRKGDKNKLHVVDVYSSLKYAKKHFKERKGYYLEAEYPVLPLKKIEYQML